MSTPITIEQLIQRDLEILGAGVRYLMGEEANCAVCGKPANLSDASAGKSLKVVNDKFEAIPMCAEHVAPRPFELATLATVPEAEIRKAWQGYIDWRKQNSPTRYFVTHPLSFFVAEQFQKNDISCVAVIDTQAMPSFLGVFPVPLTDAENNNPLFAVGGKFAADCVGFLELAQAGKLEMTLMWGHAIISVDVEGLPVIENPDIQEASK
jgi:hypothetical protein